MNGKTSQEVTETFTILEKIMSTWTEESKDICEVKIDDFLGDLTKRGWRRNDIFKLLQETYAPARPPLPDGASIYLGGVEDSITGYLHPDCIMRFADENIENIEELTAYVRSAQWKKRRTHERSNEIQAQELSASDQSSLPSKSKNASF
ncbi:hypothetical protein INH39_15050 [Massilia violaceinigra]|uniref:Uncharacterized protein n=1 Tax=Massilia violaceinigra TaxID=2045208 RepID=A0ABY4AJS4_9BURK|nr:hypothetical protein [Massilia violaceinigra]UOD32858.1 hypothetical protein INH39_15050 [Massilia violaceinigra]